MQRANIAIGTGINLSGCLCRYMRIKLMKKASNFLKQKLEGIHAGLIQAHEDSKQYAPSITGAEREIISRSLLSLALAPGYRIGTGTILDQHGDDSGQVDIVIEQPFSLSFPISSDQNRLFLAPSVCAAFEVKSDLARQGDDAMKKVAAIKRFFTDCRGSHS